MRGIFCIFFRLFLGAGGLFLGAGAASAQAIGFLASPDSPQILLTGPEGGIKTMSPDRMPCLIPGLARLERMPILRSRNGDPMPNGSTGKPPDGFTGKPVDGFIWKMIPPAGRKPAGRK